MLKAGYAFILRLRWRILQAILSPRRYVVCRGLRFSLQCDNWITHYRWRSYNTKEVETLDWIDTLVHDGDTVFDIGGNIGVFSVYIALRHPGTSVIAFEPEYANAHLFRDNIQKNDLATRVRIYAVALSNHCGLSQLHLQDLTPGAALLTESRQELRFTRTNHAVIAREGIYALTLDAFCRESGITPQCIKIDVDGTEVEILEGAPDTLNHPRLRTILIEMPDNDAHRKRCEELLIQAGFEVKWMDAGRVSPNQIWCRGPQEIAPTSRDAAGRATPLSMTTGRS
jgi:FkbM family methyltransferase